MILYCSGQKGGGVTWFVVLFSIYKSNNRSKIKYQKRVQCNNVKTHYFSQKGFSNNLQIVFKTSDLVASGFIRITIPVPWPGELQLYRQLDISHTIFNAVYIIYNAYMYVYGYFGPKFCSNKPYQLVWILCRVYKTQTTREQNCRGSTSQTGKFPPPCSLYIYVYPRVLDCSVVMQFASVRALLRLY